MSRARARVLAVVLAAGASSRMGRSKPTIEIEGRPLVARAVEAARGAGCGGVAVVVGHDAPAVGDAVPEGVDLVPNPAWAEWIRPV